MEMMSGHLERQMKKAASSRNEIYEENCWFYTSGPQKK
jgi:hypothetical protein